MAEAPSPAALRALAEFVCVDPECQANLTINLMEVENGAGLAVRCPACHREYHFDQALMDQLGRLRKALLAVQDIGDILGDTSVGITTMTGEIRIPYRLLMTRMNTVVRLDIGGQKVDFHFRAEPLNAANMIR